LATGTGGTMTGVARKLKELNKDIIVFIIIKLDCWS